MFSPISFWNTNAAINSIFTQGQIFQDGFTTDAKTWKLMPQLSTPPWKRSFTVYERVILLKDFLSVKEFLWRPLFWAFDDISSGFLKPEWAALFILGGEVQDTNSLMMAWSLSFLKTNVSIQSQIRFNLFMLVNIISPEWQLDKSSNVCNSSM